MGKAQTMSRNLVPTRSEEDAVTNMILSLPTPKTSRNIHQELMNSINPRYHPIALIMETLRNPVNFRNYYEQSFSFDTDTHLQTTTQFRSGRSFAWGSFLFALLGLQFNPGTTPLTGYYIQMKDIEDPSTGAKLTVLKISGELDFSMQVDDQGNFMFGSHFIWLLQFIGITLAGHPFMMHPRDGEKITPAYYYDTMRSFITKYQDAVRTYVDCAADQTNTLRMLYEKFVNELCKCFVDFNNTEFQFYTNQNSAFRYLMRRFETKLFDTSEIVYAKKQADFMGKLYRMTYQTFGKPSQTQGQNHNLNSDAIDRLMEKHETENAELSADIFTPENTIPTYSTYGTTSVAAGCMAPSAASNYRNLQPTVLAAPKTSLLKKTKGKIAAMFACGSDSVAEPVSFSHRQGGTPQAAGITPMETDPNPKVVDQGGRTATPVSGNSTPTFSAPSSPVLPPTSTAVPGSAAGTHRAALKLPPVRTTPRHAASTPNPDPRLRFRNGSHNDVDSD